MDDFKKYREASEQYERHIAARRQPDAPASPVPASVEVVPEQRGDSTEDKFCDANCVWTDHHKDCKFGQGAHSAEGGSE